MIQRRRGSRFLRKTLQPLAIRGERCGQNFDGDGAIQTRVVSAIHLAHAARTD
jgi:hypothetical protein